MRLYQSEQVHELDYKAESVAKIPGRLLMEHAGLEVARAVREKLGRVCGKNVLVVCGPGNNGGDGLVTARVLHDWGAKTFVYMPAGEKELKGDPKTNFEVLKTLNGNAFLDSKNFQTFLHEADIVVDALFGTGLKRPVQPPIANVIQEVNRSGKPVISVDLPSGIDGDTGKILGAAIQASITITLAVAKPGLFLYPGRTHARDVRLAYIGIPAQIISETSATALIAERHEIAGWLPVWKPDIHKGERGRVMVLGGSRGYSGAPALASMAALHSGSGLVYLGVPDGIRTLMEHKLTEVIKVGIPQSNNWVFGKPSLPETRSWYETIDALAIGPGSGRAEETQEYIRTVIQEYKGPLVVDADGLFALNEEFLKTQGRPSMILTPHEGEMGRLCGLAPAEVRENRFDLAAKKAKEWNVTLVLKGASTLIVSGDSIWINPTGNPGMATAGSGDVLTGIIVSFLGQGLTAEKASVAGAFLHGLAGDLLAQDLGLRGITAERISATLFKAFQSIP